MFSSNFTGSGIGQKYTRINRPQTSGKAERSIRTLIGHGHHRLVLETMPIDAFNLPVSLTSTIL